MDARAIRKLQDAFDVDRCLPTSMPIESRPAASRQSSPPRARSAFLTTCRSEARAFSHPNGSTVIRPGVRGSPAWFPTTQGNREPRQPCGFEARSAGP